MAAHNAMCVGPEDGHTAAWRRCHRGKKGSEDPKVSEQHGVLVRSLPCWHAGEFQAKTGLCGSGFVLKELLGIGNMVVCFLGELEKKIYITHISVC